MSNSADSGCQNDFVTQPHEEEMAQPRGFSAWTQKPLMLPQTETWAHESMGLPALASFRDIVSLQNIQSDRPSVVIGVDSEWVGQGPRRMLSWQFAVINGSDLEEIVFLPKHAGEFISCKYAVGRILDHLGIIKPQKRENLLSYRYGVSDPENRTRPGKAVWKECVTDSAGEAMKNAELAFLDGALSKIRLSDIDNGAVVLPAGKKLQRYIPFVDKGRFKETVPITLLYHAGQADLSTFLKDTDGTRGSIFRYLTKAQGGLFSMTPVSWIVPSVLYSSGSGYLYRIKLSFRDSMCFAGGESKSLETLGDVVGVPKVVISPELKARMDLLLLRDPGLFMKYASQDAVVALLYTSALFGYNREMPCTITGVAAKTAQDACMKYLHCSDPSEFNRIYRGIKTETMGPVKPESGTVKKPNFLKNTREIGLNDKARRLQLMSSAAFHGGYNASAYIGYIPKTTFDVDLKSAYPTAMCLIPDVDWEDSIISEIHNRELSLSDFHLIGRQFNPVSMMFCYCRFEFPENVKFPCIPYVIDGIPVFPRTSVCKKEKCDYVYACGPELYLALMLGAKVYVETGYRIRTLLNENGESYSIAYAMKQMVQDRGISELLYGKGSLQEQTLKVMNNSVYGKIAQAVVDKRSWSAYDGDMESLGPSAITNPVTAAMITSVVRATLLAAMNQVHHAGYTVYSVTTDGFITDMPPEDLNELDLYGFRAALNYSRKFLTGGKDESIWSVKHVQDDLLNFTTRGNVSLHSKHAGTPMIYNNKEYDGVIARNGAKSPYERMTLQDRKWIMTAVLGRTGKVYCEETSWIPFRDLAGGKDFIVFQLSRELSMDFDMKRLPIRDSFYTERPAVDGSEYEVACFDTRAFADMDDFAAYRAKAKNCKCLRTIDDWKRFWIKIDGMNSDTKTVRTQTGLPRIRDLDWSILNSVIRGYRAGLWDIPYLNDPNLTVADKCAWIQSFNHCESKIFTINDWKHAGEKKRQQTILPMETIEPLLKEMQAVQSLQ